MLKLRKADEKLTLKRVKDMGCDSVMGEGRTCLDPSQAVKLDSTTGEQTSVLLGKPIPSGIKDTSLEYNEYIVYSSDQIKIKYIVWLSFHYKY